MDTDDKTLTTDKKKSRSSKKIITQATPAQALDHPESSLGKGIRGS